MINYNHKWFNNEDNKVEKHTYIDFEVISEFHSAEGDGDSTTRRCVKCGMTVVE